MGYDMQSKMNPGDEGYFRLNIWGMGWMRGVILEGDPTLENDIFRFCSNDGHVVGEKLGKRISKALRSYISTHPVGSKARTMKAKHEVEVEKMLEQLKAQLGVDNLQAPGRSEEEKLVDQEDLDLIERFAVYNETMCPYEVW
jgi:hypothetical protein